LSVFSRHWEPRAADGATIGGEIGASTNVPRPAPIRTGEHWWRHTISQLIEDVRVWSFLFPGPKECAGNAKDRQNDHKRRKNEQSLPVSEMAITCNSDQQIDGKQCRYRRTKETDKGQCAPEDSHFGFAFRSGLALEDRSTVYLFAKREIERIDGESERRRHNYRYT
jgi:hypothetical protein